MYVNLQIMQATKIYTCGLSYIWLNQNVNCLRNILLNTVAVQFRQQWKSDIEESSKCCNQYTTTKNKISEDTG